MQKIYKIPCYAAMSQESRKVFLLLTVTEEAVKYNLSRL